MPAWQLPGLAALDPTAARKVWAAARIGLEALARAEGVRRADPELAAVLEVLRATAGGDFPSGEARHYPEGEIRPPLQRSRDRLVSTEEAAELLGVTARRIRQLRASGDLVATAVRGRLMFDAATVRSLADDRRNAR